ncbi:MAG: ABC transporter ATP-binding protein [Candidatus Bathyarchaeota archaeon]|nr:MAG: ABC transporter ATP-binding protein [Candidatus Bathyarchaeota archaeon]
MPEVRVKNATKKYGKIIAVDNVSLQIHANEYFCLLGPSGCGKTTLLRLIAGLVEPDKGEIYIENRLVTSVPPEDRGIGFVFQEYALFPHMNVWDNVTYGPRVKAMGKKKSEKLGREMLEMVRLFERFDAFPSELSGGMMQRVALARALAAGSKLLLLDEPLGALDAKIRNDLRYELRKFVKDLELTGIHVTHDQAEAMAISDRIAVMRKGKILQVGTPQELYMHPQHIFVAHFIGESDFLEGYVSKITKKESIIELRGRLFVHTLDKTHEEGDKVVIAIRPEVLTVEKGKKRRENSILGHVEGFRFEGTNVRCQIELENGDSVVVVRPALMTEWFNIGEKVTVSFPAEKSFVFTYPERGLKRELALE